MATVAFAIYISAHSSDFVSGNLFFRHTGNSATCSAVAGRAKYIGHITIPAYVTLNDKKLMVTHIAPKAFANCEQLLSVQLPAAITTIGSDAFKGCRRLSSVSLPESLLTIDNNAFAKCPSLNSIVIPNIKTVIGKNAFDPHTRVFFNAKNSPQDSKQNPKDMVLQEESPL